MNVPLEISFRDVEKTPDLEALINRKAAKLEQVSDKITSLRVSVEQDQKAQKLGNPCRVRLDINVPPGHEFAIRRESSEGHLHKDPAMLLREAFDAAWRKLRKIKEKQQGKVKTHPEQETNALVLRLFPEDDYGFLKSVDGQDVYFHRNSVVEQDFDALREGDGVTFTAVMGDKGLQATSVHMSNRPSK